jgi:hypothetical protein
MAVSIWAVPDVETPYIASMNVAFLALRTGAGGLTL